jgi:hypothetical protein
MISRIMTGKVFWDHRPFFFFSASDRSCSLPAHAGGSLAGKDSADASITGSSSRGFFRRSFGAFDLLSDGMRAPLFQ